jgi:hypothetical protein
MIVRISRAKVGHRQDLINTNARRVYPSGHLYLWKRQTPPSAGEGFCFYRPQFIDHDVCVSSRKGRPSGLPSSTSGTHTDDPLEEQGQNRRRWATARARAHGCSLVRVSQHAFPCASACASACSRVADSRPIASARACTCMPVSLRALGRACTSASQRSGARLCIQGQSSPTTHCSLSRARVMADHLGTSFALLRARQPSGMTAFVGSSSNCDNVNPTQILITLVKPVTCSS